MQVHPDRLRAAGETLDQIVSTTGNALLVSPLSFLEASTPGTGGFIDTPNQRLGVQHLSPIETAEQLAKVVVEDSGARLRLGDVTTVVEDSQPLIGDARLSTGDGFLLVVEKFAGANTLEVTRAVEDALASMGPGLKGLEMDTTVFRPASYIDCHRKPADNGADRGGAHAPGGRGPPVQLAAGCRHHRRGVPVHGSRGPKMPFITSPAHSLSARCWWSGCSPCSSSTGAQPW